MEPITKVTQEDVELMLGNAEIQEHIFWGKELVVSYKLWNGFIVMGRATCVNPEDFELCVARRVAFEYAQSAVRLLLRYQLQTDLFNKGYVAA